MTTYNTYAEAKIANPTSEIYWYLDDGLKTVFTPSEFRTGSENNLASPAKHCMGLDDFFEAGYKLVDGDAYLFNGEVIVVGDKISAGLVNGGRTFDDLRFVLSAKALEEKVEQVEWNGEGFPPVGAKCEFEYPKGHWNSGYYHGKTSSGSKMHILEYEGGRLETLGGLTKFRKPETPEQKKKREEKEAARHLRGIITNAYLPNGRKARLSDDMLEELENLWVSIVKETGYRKPE